MFYDLFKIANRCRGECFVPSFFNPFGCGFIKLRTYSYELAMD